MTGGTYAYLDLQSNSGSVTGMGGCFNVNYSAQEITSADLTATDNYLDGTSTTISLSKNSGCKIYNYANIYINTNNSTTAPVETISALKYKLFNGDTLIAQGAINKKGKQLITKVMLSDTTVIYTLYIWLDNQLSMGNFDSTSYSGYIYADSTQTSTIPTATFLTGSEVNIKMKNLAGDNVSSANTADTNITAILKSNTPPDESIMTEDNIVSTTDSDFPIYMWYDNGTIYWWSGDDKPNLNSTSNSMFNNLRSLTNISGLANWDAGNVTRMSSMFMYCQSLTSLQALESWDVSNVTNMQGLFSGDESLTNINAISNWNVSNVANMQALFSGDESLTNINAISNWNVSNVENMSMMFNKCTSLTSFQSLANWDVSKVYKINSMFRYDSSIINLKGLENWNVSNVTIFNTMFQECDNLQDASAINNWDLNSEATFTQMFKDTPVHPNFTKYQGTWDSNGTFTITS